MAMGSGGYIKGKPISLMVLDYGLFKVHANGRIIGICGFLLRTDQDETVLIDTGFPRHYADDPTSASVADGLGSFGEVLHLTEANLPAGQLALAGLTLSDIDLFILTHSHIDHVGGIADLPDVPILLAAAERALPRPLYFGKRQPMEWPDAKYLTIDGDCDIGPGLRALFAPGHAPGQLAFMVDLPETGAVLLTSDAISRPAEVDERFDTAPDPDLACKSAARLLTLAAARDAFVIYGHCPHQWPLLKKAPLIYT
jgi:N-acyl homoserine lactone hydrolase